MVRQKWCIVFHVKWENEPRIHHQNYGQNYGSLVTIPIASGSWRRRSLLFGFVSFYDVIRVKSSAALVILSNITMKITITTMSDEMFTIDVSDEMELENFKAFCEFECSIPAQEITIIWNGQPLLDNKSKLKDYGICDGDVLLIQRIQGSGGQGAAQGARHSGQRSSGNAITNKIF